MLAPERGFAKCSLKRIENMRFLCDCINWDLMEIRNRKWRMEEFPYKTSSIDKLRSAMREVDLAMDILYDALEQMRKEEEKGTSATNGPSGRCACRD